MNIRKIPPYLTEAVQSSAAAGQSGAEEKAAAGNGVSADRVQLSKDYQDMASAQASITTGSGGIRTEKVQEIKKQVESGSYEIKPGAIADKMLDEII
jgi:flagellar biosynthesis anti-sigma factor FlgM